MAAGHSQQWLPAHQSTSNWTTLHFHGQKATKRSTNQHQQIQEQQLPHFSSGITWWDHCLELSDEFLFIHSWFSAKGIYREWWMLLLLTEIKPQYTTNPSDKLMLCFVITTSLPLTSNTKENYKLWNKPINENYVSLKDFIRCISIKIKGQDLLTVARWEILIANTNIHQLDV